MSDVDPELSAMGGVAAILTALPDDDTRQRVLRWAAERFGTQLVSKPLAVGPASAQQARSFDSFADLFDAVRPVSEKEKALAAAYWRSQIEGSAQFQAQELNGLLKDLGYRSGNITDALSASIQERPALILQLKKAGSSRQARKTYKLSTHGIRWVEARLRGEDAE